jgi:transcriptional regulator with XRE-family HTH domain
MTSAVATLPRTVQPAPAIELCLLCGASLHRASTRGFGARGVCGGCAERLEMDLTGSDSASCPDCGRHRELCAVMPCNLPQPEVHQPVPLIKKPNRGQVSGAERVKTIERLAMSHLGVRELGRRTGFAPSTISRWLKIDRSPLLKHALATEALDIGRAKLLADAPETALTELIQLAPKVSRGDLARRVAALRTSDGTSATVAREPTPTSRRLRNALSSLESISRVDIADQPVLQRLLHILQELNTGQPTFANVSQIH